MQNKIKINQITLQNINFVLLYFFSEILRRGFVILVSVELNVNLAN